MHIHLLSIFAHIIPALVCVALTLVVAPTFNLLEFWNTIGHILSIF